MSRLLTICIALAVTGGYVLMLASIAIPWHTRPSASSRAESLKLMHIAKEDAEGAPAHLIPEDPSPQEELDDAPKENILDHTDAELEHNFLEKEPELVQPEAVQQDADAEHAQDEEPASETAAQREPLASQQEQIQKTELPYRDIADVTAAPQFPLDILGDRLVYPPLARRQGREGVVLLELFISAQGYVEQVEIIEDPGYGMGEAARNAFSGLRADPAEIDGEKAAVRMRYPVRFSLTP